MTPLLKEQWAVGSPGGTGRASFARPLGAYDVSFLLNLLIFAMTLMSLSTPLYRHI